MTKMAQSVRTTLFPAVIAELVQHRQNLLLFPKDRSTRRLLVLSPVGMFQGSTPVITKVGCFHLSSARVVGKGGQKEAMHVLS